MKKKMKITILLLGISGVGRTSFVKRILAEPILTLPTEKPEIVKKKLKDIPAIKKYFQFKEISDKSQLIIVDTPGKFKERRLWRELLQEHQPAAVFFFINDDERAWPEQVSAMEDLYNYWHDTFVVAGANSRRRNLHEQASMQNSSPVLIKILCNPFHLEKGNIEQKQELLEKIRNHFGHVIEAFKEIPLITLNIAVLSVPRDSIADVIIQLVEVMRFLASHSLKKK